MKKYFFILLVMILFLTSCNFVNLKSGYIPYDDISENYSLDDAKNDNCVVYEDSKITSGQFAWDNFIEKVQKNKSCFIRLAFYYTLDGQNISPEHYEEIKNDYPALYIQDLKFDGSKYNLSFSEEGKKYSYTYKYMKKFTEEPKNNTAAFSQWTRYVLVNDDTVTWEQIIHGIVSSKSGDWIDHKTVYSDFL